MKNLQLKLLLGLTIGIASTQYVFAALEYEDQKEEEVIQESTESVPTIQQAPTVESTQESTTGEQKVMSEDVASTTNSESSSVEKQNLSTVPGGQNVNITVENKNNNENENSAVSDVDSDASADVKSSLSQQSTVSQDKPIADGMKNRRQTIEQHTESQMQEKLEEARAKEEIQRAQRILNKIDESSQKDVRIQDSAPQRQEPAINNQPQQIIIQPAQPSQPVEDYPSDSTSMEEVNTKAFKRASLTGGLGLGVLSDVSGFESEGKISWNGMATYHATEKVALDLGYTYSLYELRPTSGRFAENDFIRNQYDMTQQIFSVDTRYFLTDASSQLRPYAGVGVSYILTNLNFRSEDIYGFTYKRRSEIDSFAGQLQGGAELSLAENFSLGLGGKYFYILSSNADTSRSRANMYDVYYVGAVTNYDLEKEKRKSQEFGEASFFQVLGTLKFHF